MARATNFLETIATGVAVVVQPTIPKDVGLHVSR